MDFLLQTEGDWLDSWSLFCYALISGGEKGATMSKFLSYEDRMIIAQRLQENASFGAIGKELGRTVQRLPRRLKSIPMTRKADVPDIRIILANSAFHAKQKNCAERAVRIHPHTNAVYARSARFTVRIL